MGVAMLDLLKVIQELSSICLHVLCMSMWCTTKAV